VAIVDFGLGNLYSVQRACAQVGLEAIITSERAQVDEAAAVILPGVGAFGDAMANLRDLGLVEPLREVEQSGRPLMGICLGMQLMLSESREFGHHLGLGLIEGEVVALEHGQENGRAVKVPQVGWNRLKPARDWQGSLLQGVPAGEFMYFVHSFHCRPADPDLVLAAGDYGTNHFCAALKRGNLEACQFHPERSGRAGLVMYRNLAARLAAGL
jgi:glutamine amidotransferase